MGQAMEQVRDYIALIMTVAILGMVAFKVAMPDRIWDIYMMVIAFFFGSKQSTGGLNDTNINSSSHIVTDTVASKGGQPIPIAGTESGIKP